MGLGVPALARFGDGALHVVADRGERLEVRVEDHLRVGGGDRQPLAQAVGLHAVGQTVRDHLRLGPLVDGDVTGIDTEHP